MVLPHPMLVFPFFHLLRAFLVGILGEKNVGTPNMVTPIRLADEIYNAKVGGASSPEKPKEVSPTKNCFLSLSFISASSQDQLR